MRQIINHYFIVEAYEKLVEDIHELLNHKTKHLDIEESKIVEEASLTEDLGADSFDTVELIMALEEQFEIEISDDEAQEILTVKNAIDFINQKISKKEEI